LFTGKVKFTSAPPEVDLNSIAAVFNVTSVPLKANTKPGFFNVFAKKLRTLSNARSQLF